MAAAEAALVQAGRDAQPGLLRQQLVAQAQQALLLLRSFIDESAYLS